MNKTPTRLVCLLIGLFAWAENDALVAHALSSSSKTCESNNNNNNDDDNTCAATPRIVISPEDVSRIANGRVAVLQNFVPSELVQRLRADAKKLQGEGHFRPDGLTNNAKGSLDQQGFEKTSDRQTFRNPETGEQSWYRSDLGDYGARMEFDALLASVRRQLAEDLRRPTLATSETTNRHESTYNWYEPGAKLGRHLDEHHEETKGPKGWLFPSRRSVTWLVYLNQDWQDQEGGALLCHPRLGEETLVGPIGSHEGNLQVGWMDGYTPVYLDAFRESGQTALYSCSESSSSSSERIYWTKTDFDVPVTPIDFSPFLSKELQGRFEQISTAKKDPRFAKAASGAPVEAGVEPTASDCSDERLEVVPTGGTLVLFDSVTLPHSVLPVTGNRQRIAATGWFHEDSQFLFAV